MKQHLIILLLCLIVITGCKANTISSDIDQPINVDLLVPDALEKEEEIPFQIQAVKAGEEILIEKLEIKIWRDDEAQRTFISKGRDQIKHGIFYHQFDKEGVYILQVNLTASGQQRIVKTALAVGEAAKEDLKNMTDDNSDLSTDHSHH
ncbi:hypothetical protein M3689_02500 [Alkalihalophilus marmarensis]|uniref:YtkA-like n=1 Tax=Alkalihalophilus marmarensis DSM 21297 TaxID=1188261 RepID=U6SQX7_9BACI|nr:hypothetical protein [Alkalihalophilus marmarensis]ERN54008.1 hypothetical protein A33I_08535 [Alkalihalophilus marmarensis DSM 21297]MCM3488173.1 hypothetical protein [Alkalihalophilus marmarensis]